MIVLAKTFIARQLTEEILKHGIATCVDIASESVDPILTEKFLDLKLILDDHRTRDNNIYYAFVIGRNGEILAHTFGEGFPTDLRDANAVEAGKPHGVSILETGDKETIFDIAAPVLSGEGSVVRLGISGRHVLNSVRRMVWIISGLTFSVIVLGCFAGVIIAARITAPLSELVRATREVGRGNLAARARITTNDEIAELDAAFNNMVADLQATIVTKSYLDTILRSIPDPLFVTDPEGRIKTVNPVTATLLGYGDGEMAGKPLGMFLRDVHGNGPGAAGDIPSGEAVLVAADGTRIHVLLSVSVTPKRAGEPGELLFVAKDITRRKQAEETLARLAMAVEQAGEAIMITDTEGTIEYVNPAFAQITGYRPEEIMGKNPRVLKSGRHDANFYREMWNTIRAGKTWSGILVNKARDGKLFEEAAVISPVRNAYGTVINYVAVKRDVTHEVQLEEQLRQAQKMEAVGKLAGGIAHDFNNLLTAILGYIDLLLVQIPEESPLRREVDGIKMASERATGLTRQLLAFSRKQILQPKVIQLNTILVGMDQMLRRLIGEDILLLTKTAGDLWNVRMDPGQLEQAIVNLVVNARDAMPEGGKLTLETANVDLGEDYVQLHVAIRPGSYAMLAVSDTGCGMSEEVKARIFEPFFTTKETGKGTGLGLSTVYGIVKQSRGYIWVYSEPDKGTTFKIYLPRVEEATEEAIAVPVEKPPKKSEGRETVLVAEDEDFVRDLIEEILHANGYTVLSARDGKDAIRISDQYDGEIHLLLTDVVMPHLSGRILSENIKTRRPGIKVLHMSGYTENAIVHHGVLDPGMNFIQKPFRMAILLRKVREILEQ